MDRADSRPAAPRSREAVQSTLRSLRHLVGGTPLVAIRCRLDGRDRTVYAKLESLNFTGSIKDRMALQILREAYDDGAIEPGDTIAEASSGNTGISFAALGRALGHPVRVFLPDWMSRERVAVIRSLGATLVPVSAAEGGFQGSIDRACDLARREPHVFLPRQFESLANVRAHLQTTGPEIREQLRFLGKRPTAFVAGVGTGGTVMGVGADLRSAFGDVAVHPLEPASSPTLRTGHKVGTHRIQGIGDEFVPAIVDLAWLDEIVDVADGDAIAMARRLASELGLAVGISSGANFLGALDVACRQGSGAVVATVFADSNKKYLSTALFAEGAPEPSPFADRVELLGFDAVGRGCGTCLPARS